MARVQHWGARGDSGRCRPRHRRAPGGVGSGDGEKPAACRMLPQLARAGALRRRGRPPAGHPGTQRWNAGAAAAGAAGGAVGGVAPPSSQSGGPRGGPVPGEVHGARAAEAAREGGAAFGGPVPGAAARPRRRSGWWYGGTLVAHCMLPF